MPSEMNINNFDSVKKYLIEVEGVPESPRESRGHGPLHAASNVDDLFNHVLFGGTPTKTLGTVKAKKIREVDVAKIREHLTKDNKELVAKRLVIAYLQAKAPTRKEQLKLLYEKIFSSAPIEQAPPTLPVSITRPKTQPQTPSFVRKLFPPTAHPKAVFFTKEERQGVPAVRPGELSSISEGGAEPESPSSETLATLVQHATRQAVSEAEFGDPEKAKAALQHASSALQKMPKGALKEQASQQIEKVRPKIDKAEVEAAAMKEILGRAPSEQERANLRETSNSLVQLTENLVKDAEACAKRGDMETASHIAQVAATYASLVELSPQKTEALAFAERTKQAAQVPSSPSSLLTKKEMSATNFPKRADISAAVIAASKGQQITMKSYATLAKQLGQAAGQVALSGDKEAAEVLVTLAWSAVDQIPMIPRSASDNERNREIHTAKMRAVVAARTATETMDAATAVQVAEGVLPEVTRAAYKQIMELAASTAEEALAASDASLARHAHTIALQIAAKVPDAVQNEIEGFQAALSRVKLAAEKAATNQKSNDSLIRVAHMALSSAYLLALHGQAKEARLLYLMACKSADKVPIGNRVDLESNLSSGVGIAVRRAMQDLTSPVAPVPAARKSEPEPGAVIALRLLEDAVHDAEGAAVSGDVEGAKKAAQMAAEITIGPTTQEWKKQADSLIKKVTQAVSAAGIEAARRAAVAQALQEKVETCEKLADAAVDAAARGLVVEARKAETAVFKLSGGHANAEDINEVIGDYTRRLSTAPHVVSSTPASSRTVATDPKVRILRAVQKARKAVRKFSP